MHMAIEDIQNIYTGETRTDSQYQERIGCVVRFACNEPPRRGYRMVLAYERDRFGEPKPGFCVTSKVQAVKSGRGHRLIVETENSRFFLKVLSRKEK